MRQPRFKGVVKAQLLHKSMNSTFYTPADSMKQDAREVLKSVQNFKPAVQLDPSTVKTEIQPMSESEKAFFLARKYHKDDPTFCLKQIWKDCRKKQMSQRNIEIVMRIVGEIKAATKNKASQS